MYAAVIASAPRHRECLRKCPGEIAFFREALPGRATNPPGAGCARCSRRRSKDMADQFVLPPFAKRSFPRQMAKERRRWAIERFLTTRQRSLACAPQRLM